MSVDDVLKFYFYFFSRKLPLTKGRMENKSSHTTDYTSQQDYQEEKKKQTDRMSSHTMSFREFVRIRYCRKQSNVFGELLNRVKFSMFFPQLFHHIE